MFGHLVIWYLIGKYQRTYLLPLKKIDHYRILLTLNKHTFIHFICYMHLVHSSNVLHYLTKKDKYNRKFYVSTEPITWFISKISMSVHFIWLAKKWPALMIEWQRIEKSLPACTRKRTISIPNQIKLITIIMVITALSWVSDIFYHHFFQIYPCYITNVVNRNKTHTNAHIK